MQALQEIRNRRPDLLMAVLTNKPVNPSRAICSALGLEPFFFANYGGNSFATKKPVPEGILAIMSEARLLSTARQQSDRDLPDSGVVMIGDSPVDVRTARAAGGRSLGCLYGLAPAELQREMPDRMVTAPSEWVVELDTL